MGKRVMQPGCKLDARIGDIMVRHCEWTRVDSNELVMFMDENDVFPHFVPKDDTDLADAPIFTQALWSPSRKIEDAHLADSLDWEWRVFEYREANRVGVSVGSVNGDWGSSMVYFKDYPNKAAAHAHARCLALLNAFGNGWNHPRVAYPSARTKTISARRACSGPRCLRRYLRPDLPGRIRPSRWAITPTHERHWIEESTPRVVGRAGKEV